MAWTYASMAVELDMSISQIHSAVKRALASGLAIQTEKKIMPNIRNLNEFLVSGLKYVFIPEQGEMTRGMPTSYAAPPLDSLFVPDGEPLPVWPDPEGTVRGISFSPLYKASSAAARRDQNLYELLALVDAIRSGRARERMIAVKELEKRLDAYESNIKS